MRISQSLLLVASLLLAAPAIAERPRVTLASGVVVGTTTRLPKATAAVNKFIGVPYAKTPPLRFAPAQPHPSWTKPWDASVTKPSCMQQFNYRGGDDSGRKRLMATFYYPAGPPDIPDSEDCMYLNIYTPPGTKASSRKPILVYIFGGDQAFGGGSYHWWDGSSFAYYEDIIVLTFNRRTNVFGFPASPEIAKDKQNLGFLDQRFVLQWIQDNIAKFGGDPGKVTIMGESSGATEAKMLMAIPPKPVPFRGVIMQSEASSNVGDGAQSWPKLLKAMGCDKARSGVKCLRTKSAKSIQYKLEHQAILFPPVFDDKTYVLDTRPYIENGTAAKVPFIIGTDQDEGRPFVYDRGLAQSDAALIDFLAGFFPGQKAVLEGLAPITQPLGQLTYLTASKVIRDLLFVCRASGIAKHAKANGYKVWRYVYDATFANIKPFPNPGAFHSSELPIVFGNYPLNNATRAQRKFSRHVQSGWAKFVKNPASGPGWPELGSGNLGRLQVNGGEQTVTASSVDTDSQCEIYSIVIAPRGY